MSLEASPKEFVLSFEYPCSNEIEANIICDVLKVDKEPKRSSVTKTLSVVKDVLHVTLCTSNVKNLKPSFNSLLDYIMLSKETIDQFGPPVTKT